MEDHLRIRSWIFSMRGVAVLAFASIFSTTHGEQHCKTASDQETILHYGFVDGAVSDVPATHVQYTLNSSISRFWGLFARTGVQLQQLYE